MQERKEQLPIALDLPGAKFQMVEWGETSVAYIQLAAGANATPLLEGLPDDKCHCPHWGYVLEGAVNIRYTDGKEEVSKAGEVFYWRPGHTVWVDEDTSLVEFSPKQELKEIYDHINRKVSAAA